MKYYLFNGSPRTNWNTAKMLQSAKEGMIDTLNELKPDEEHVVEIIDLFKLNFDGCRSCFNCKVIDGPFYGTCPVNDDLKDILPEVWDCDGIIIGSPIYFADITGQARNLIERIGFPKLVYGGESLAEKKIPSALFLTMNATEEYYDLFVGSVNAAKMGMGVICKDTVVVNAYNTVQFDDYSKYENYSFDPDEKHAYEKENFPKVLEDAYNTGASIVRQSLEL